MATGPRAAVGRSASWRRPGRRPQQPPATALPAPISLAATWDRSAAGVYGAVQGEETRDLAESLIEAPDVNLACVPENGRTLESCEEDPHLDGQVAVANIDAVQRQGIIAEVKHLAANNQESSRFTIDELIDDRTLHDPSRRCTCPTSRQSYGTPTPAP
jgi:beta-glucosidase